ncbi:MAG: LapA family protein [Alphaproteobacteria bacterium]|nr:LapA family protein [Alphaproteobacteria bacterium]
MKLLLWLLLLPLTLIFIAFAIANRHAVTLSLDPTPLSIEAPLYGAVFAGIFIGLIAGGLIAWLRAGRWRRQLRMEQRNVRRLEEELRAAGNAGLAPGAETSGAPKSGATAMVKAA